MILPINTTRKKILINKTVLNDVNPAYERFKLA